MLTSVTLHLQVVSWSKPVSRTSIDRAARALGVSSTDIALYAATEALRAYFEQTNNAAPETVLATARAASEDFLFTFAEGDGKNYKKSQTGGTNAKLSGIPFSAVCKLYECMSFATRRHPRRVESVAGQTTMSRLYLFDHSQSPLVMNEYHSSYMN